MRPATTTRQRGGNVDAVAVCGSYGVSAAAGGVARRRSVAERVDPATTARAAAPALRISSTSSLPVVWTKLKVPGTVFGTLVFRQSI